MIALVGDAELDEGNIFEAMLEGWKQGLRNCWWIVDYNRQSLDAVVREGLWQRFEELFRAFGWDVVILKYGALLEAAGNTHRSALRHRGTVPESNSSSYACRSPEVRTGGTMDMRPPRPARSPVGVWSIAQPGRASAKPASNASISPVVRPRANVVARNCKAPTVYSIIASRDYGRRVICCHFTPSRHRHRLGMARQELIFNAELPGRVRQARSAHRTE